MEIEVNGKTYPLKAGWKSGTLINETVGDPVLILRDHVTQMEMQKIGVNYTPAVEFGFVNSVKIVHAGAVAGGAELTLEEIGDAYTGDKSADLINVASVFIQSFMDGAVDLSDGKKKAKNQKT